jgi:MoaA/NifB/PqqE/SkfB family radical SAM enzyme
VLNRRDKLASADLDEIVRGVLQAGVTQLFLSGGEPLQRFADVLRIAAMASAEADVWILSSGKGLTMEKAERLRDAGLTGVALSLDHWDAKAHDAFRGATNTFDGVRIAAGNVRSAGLVLALSLCPTKAFVSDQALRRYATTAHSLGAAFIQIFEPKAVGHYSGLDVTLDAAQQSILETFAQRTNYGADERGMPVVAYLDLSVRQRGCRGSGDRYFYVDTAGSLQPCPFCRNDGVPVLDYGFDDALTRLRQVGCMSECNRAASIGLQEKQVAVY